MAQVCYPPLLAAAEAFDHSLDRLGNGLPGAVQNTRVRVALEDDRPATTDLDGLLGVSEPVKADNVVTEIADRIEGEPSTLGEHGHGDGIEAQLREARGEMLGDVLEVGLGELLERRGRVLAGPRVKYHHQLQSRSLSAVAAIRLELPGGGGGS